MLHVVFWIQDPRPYIPLDLVYCANNQFIFVGIYWICSQSGMLKVFKPTSNLSISARFEISLILHISMFNTLNCMNDALLWCTLKF